MNSLSSNTTPLLPQISSPDDLKALPEEQLTDLAQEIRHRLISTLSNTGGHLGPNLGLVEFTIALHRVFNSPKDKILFDVSHQSYIHKLLTGRESSFHTMRQYQGLSGFMKRSESEHDCFGAGHAGTAISAGLGIAAARDLAKESFDVISVVGDGCFTCGTTLEALNNIATTTKKFIVVLNDNEWSIDKNVGALSQYFSSLQETKAYNWLRSTSSALIEKLAGREAKEQASKLVSTAQGLITPLSFFQELGLSYLGPIDGHDIARLERVLRIAQRRNGPCIIHIITEKGKGYAPAEDNPPGFHGVGRYDIHDGSVQSSSRITYSEAFGQCLSHMAEADNKIVAITAAMPTGTKLNIFRKQHPERFFDVGIAEEHAAIFACGLAAQGLKPYLAIYSTFMQRCVDMIEHDAALQHLPVRFCMDRAGLSPDDGPTHHGLFDIAMLRAIPNLVMMQPKDEAELVDMLATMNTIEDRPSAIRYPRGEGEGVSMFAEGEALALGQAEVIADGEQVALFALGNMNALAAAVKTRLEEKGISLAHINARFIKPIDKQCILGYAKKCKLIVCLEDHSRVGGFGSSVLEVLSEANCKTETLLIGWPDEFVEHGTLDILREKHGLTPQAISQRILEQLEH